MASAPIATTIREKLRELEQTEKIVVFFACESGSRAWGFPSADSDYDVRFLYLHPPDWYLSIEDRRDVIERPLDNEIDLSGWEIRKALRLLRKSNPPLLEWLSSPIIYQQKSTIPDKFRASLAKYYSPRDCFHHYLHMAEGNFREYLRGETVRVKKYFYVLRPVLACQWIEAGLGPVPMEFGILVEKLVASNNLKAEILSLIHRKQSGQELDWERRIPPISDFIETELTRLKSLETPQPQTTSEPDDLDSLFRGALKEIWN